MKARYRLVTVLALAVLAPAARAADPPAPFITSTVAEIGRPYTVIDGLCVYQKVLGAPAGGEPVEQALNAAFKKVKEVAVKVNANALVGFDVDFTSLSAKGEETRLVLCGTLVKYR